jgi:choline dehydrogenase-like flavoprotein
VGGSSAINAMIYCRGHRASYESQPGAGRSVEHLIRDFLMDFGFIGPGVESFVDANGVGGSEASFVRS